VRHRDSATASTSHDRTGFNWLLDVDGGEFDQLTGASVTPRAVIKAIRDTLIYFDAHRDEIFTMPASEEQQ
jgi:electron transport complex protein RnfG